MIHYFNQYFFGCSVSQPNVDSTITTHLETHPFDVIKVLLPNPVKTVLITLNEQHWHFQFIIALFINWYTNKMLVKSLNFIKGRFVFPLAPLRHAF